MSIFGNIWEEDEDKKEQGSGAVVVRQSQTESLNRTAARGDKIFGDLWKEEEAPAHAPAPQETIPVYQPKEEEAGFLKNAGRVFVDFAKETQFSPITLSLKGLDFAASLPWKLADKTSDLLMKNDAYAKYMEEAAAGIDEGGGGAAMGVLETSKNLGHAAVMDFKPVMNTDTGKAVITNIEEYTSHLPLRIVAGFRAIGDNTFEEAYNSMKAGAEDPNNGAFEKFLWQIEDAGVQSGLGILMSVGAFYATGGRANFLPALFASQAVPAPYYASLSASEQIQEKGEVYSNTNILIDTIGDSILNSALLGFFKVPASVAGRLLLDSQIEGLTEVSQTLLKFSNDYARAKTEEEKLAIMEDAKTYVTSGAILYEYGVGATVGLVAGGGVEVLNSRQQQAIDKGTRDVETSLAFPIDEAIKAGDVDPATVYQNGKDGVLTPQFAEGRVNDVAQKLGRVDPALETQYREMVDVNNVTMEGTMQTGVDILVEYGGMTKQQASEVLNTAGSADYPSGGEKKPADIEQVVERIAEADSGATLNPEQQQQLVEDRAAFNDYANIFQNTTTMVPSPVATESPVVQIQVVPVGDKVAVKYSADAGDASLLIDYDLSTLYRNAEEANEAAMNAIGTWVESQRQNSGLSPVTQTRLEDIARGIRQPKKQTVPTKPKARETGKTQPTAPVAGGFGVGAVVTFGGRERTVTTVVPLGKDFKYLLTDSEGRETWLNQAAMKLLMKGKDVATSERDVENADIEQTEDGYTVKLKGEGNVYVSKDGTVVALKGEPTKKKNPDLFFETEEQAAEVLKTGTGVDLTTKKLIDEKPKKAELPSGYLPAGAIIKRLKEQGYTAEQISNALADSRSREVTGVEQFDTEQVLANLEAQKQKQEAEPDTKIRFDKEFGYVASRKKGDKFVVVGTFSTLEKAEEYLKTGEETTQKEEPDDLQQRLTKARQDLRDGFMADSLALTRTNANKKLDEQLNENTNGLIVEYGTLRNFVETAVLDKETYFTKKGKDLDGKDKYTIQKNLGDNRTVTVSLSKVAYDYFEYLSPRVTNIAPDLIKGFGGEIAKLQSGEAKRDNEKRQSKKNVLPSTKKAETNGSMDILRALEEREQSGDQNVLIKAINRKTGEERYATVQKVNAKKGTVDTYEYERMSVDKYFFENWDGSAPEPKTDGEKIWNTTPDELAKSKKFTEMRNEEFVNTAIEYYKTTEDYLTTPENEKGWAITSSRALINDQWAQMQEYRRKAEKARPTTDDSLAWDKFTAKVKTAAGYVDVSADQNLVVYHSKWGNADTYYVTRDVFMDAYKAKEAAKTLEQNLKVGDVVVYTQFTGMAPSVGEVTKINRSLDKSKVTSINVSGALSNQKPAKIEFANVYVNGRPVASIRHEWGTLSVQYNNAQSVGFAISNAEQAKGQLEGLAAGTHVRGLENRIAALKNLKALYEKSALPPETPEGVEETATKLEEEGKPDKAAIVRNNAATITVVPDSMTDEVEVIKKPKGMTWGQMLKIGNGTTAELVDLKGSWGTSAWVLEGTAPTEVRNLAERVRDYKDKTITDAMGAKLTNPENYRPARVIAIQDLETPVVKSKGYTVKRIAVVKDDQGNTGLVNADVLDFLRVETGDSNVSMTPNGKHFMFRLGDNTYIAGLQTQPDKPYLVKTERAVAGAQVAPKKKSVLPSTKKAANVEENQLLITLSDLQGEIDMFVAQGKSPKDAAKEAKTVKILATGTEERPPQLVTKTEIKDLLPTGKDRMVFTVLDENDTLYLYYKDAQSETRLRPSALGLVETNLKVGQEVVLDVAELKQKGSFFNAVDKDGRVLAEPRQKTKGEWLVSLARSSDSFAEFLSKVGKPYYHGTKSTFAKFSARAKGKNTEWDNTRLGFFFLDSETEARKFVDEYAAVYADAGKKTRVVEAYLDLKKTIDLTLNGILTKEDQATALVEATLGEKMSPKKALEFLNEEIDLGTVTEFYDALYQNPDARAVFARYGYDSAIASFGNDQLEYIAFYPSQITTREQLEAVYSAVKSGNVKGESSNVLAESFNTITDSEKFDFIAAYTARGDNRDVADRLMTPRIVRWLERDRLGRDTIEFDKNGYATLYRRNDMVEGRIQSYSLNKMWEDQLPYKVHMDDVLLAIDSKEVFDLYRSVNQKPEIRDAYVESLQSWIDFEGAEVLVRTQNTTPAVQPRDTKGRFASNDRAEFRGTLSEEYSSVSKRVRKAEPAGEKPSRFLAREPETESKVGDVSLNEEGLKKGETIEYDKLVKRSEIARILKTKLNVLVRYGKFRQQAAGIYKPDTDTVRLKGTYRNPREGGQFTTLVHEIGHFVDFSVQKFRNVIPKNELPSLLSEYGGGFDSVPVNKRRMEAFAEFLRYYITEPQKLENKAPEFTKLFDEAMKAYPEVHGAFLTAREDFKRWREQPAVAKVAAQISFEDQDTEGARAKINRWAHEIYRDALDDLHPLSQFSALAKEKLPNLEASNDPYILARNLRGWVGRAQYFLENGAIGRKFWKKGDNGHFYVDKKGKSLKEILQPTEDAGALNDLSVYLVARRAVELNNRDIATGITLEDAQEALVTLEKAHPEFASVAAELDTYQDNLLAYLMESQLLAPETYAKMKKMNKMYVPYYRVQEKLAESGYMGGKKIQAKNPIKRIKGSEKEIIDPIESIVKNTYSLINAAEQHNVLKAMEKLARSDKGLGRLFEHVPVDQTKVASVNARDIVFQALGATTEFDKLFLPSEVQAGIDIMVPDEMVNIFRPSFLQKGNVVAVMTNGKPKYYEVEPELYKALNAMEVEEVGMFVRIFSLPASFLRAGATLSPDFMIRNPIRDTLQAGIVSDNNFKPVFDTLRGMASLLRQDQYYQAWRIAGGQQSVLVAIDRENLQQNKKELLSWKERNKKYIKNPLEILQLLSATTEQATRIGEARLALLKNKSPEQAAFDAREITLDFLRIGAKTRAMNKLVAFFNAKFQGYDRTARAFIEHPTRTSWRVFQYIVLPSIILYALNRDEEDWDEIPQWQKNTFWLVKVNDTWYRIPKPFDLGYVFGTVPENFLAYLDGKKKAEMGDILQPFVSGFVLPFVPTAALPILENITNYSFFLDRPIVSEGLQDLPPEAQYTRTTSEIAKGLGDLLNVSPAKVDNLIKGYFAGLGQYINSGVEKVLEKTGINPPRVPEPSDTLADFPVLKAFVVREPIGSSSNSVNDFYAERDKSTKTYNRYKDILETGDYDTARAYLADHPEINMYKPYNKVADQLSDLRKMRDQVYESATLSPDDKRVKIDELNRLMTELAYKAINMELK